MKVVLYVNGEEGLLTSKVALSHSDISHIVIPQGRENQEIAAFASKNCISIEEREEKTAIDLEEYSGCVLLSSAFPFKILDAEVNAVSQAVNFHAAILPKYRGIHGGAWARINDEPELGVTVHEINEKFDDGKILAIEKFRVLDEDTFSDMHEKTMKALRTIVVDFLTGELNISEKFDDNNGVYWRARTPVDGRVSWHSDVRTVFVFIRALARPGIWAWSNYNRHHFIFKNSQMTEEKVNGLIPGTVILRGSDIYVVCGNSQLLKIVDYDSNSGSTLKDGMVLH